MCQKFDTTFDEEVLCLYWKYKCSCSYIVSVTYLWDDLELRTKWNKLETEGIKRVSIPENIYSLGRKNVPGVYCIHCSTVNQHTLPL